MLVVDAANVVGSRPTGWWRDRAGASRTFVEHIRRAVGAGRVPPPVVVVLEGKARPGAPAGTLDGVAVVHASGSGDDTLIDVIEREREKGGSAITLVTADRALRQRADALGAEVVGPGWLLALLTE